GLEMAIGTHGRSQDRRAFIPMVIGTPGPALTPEGSGRQTPELSHEVVILAHRDDGVARYPAGDPRGVPSGAICAQRPALATERDRRRGLLSPVVRVPRQAPGRSGRSRRSHGDGGFHETLRLAAERNGT